MPGQPSKRQVREINAIEARITENTGRARDAMNAAAQSGLTPSRAYEALRSVEISVQLVVSDMQLKARAKREDWVPLADFFKVVVDVPQAEIQDKMRHHALSIATEILHKADAKRWRHPYDMSLFEKLRKQLIDAGYTDKTLDAGFEHIGTRRELVEEWDNCGEVKLLRPELSDRKQSIEP